jgi:hypothetical protein
MLIEMQRTMEKEMTNRLEKEIAERTKEMAEETSRLEKEMTNRLEKEIAERMKEMAEETSRLEKEMTRRLEKEMEKTSRLEEKTSRLEKEIKDEQKKRSVLEVDVDDLKQSTNDIADWIVAGVCCISHFFVLFTHPFISAFLKTVANLFDGFKSVIFWIVFKQS